MVSISSGKSGDGDDGDGDDGDGDGDDGEGDGGYDVDFHHLDNPGWLDPCTR